MGFYSYYLGVVLVEGVWQVDFEEYLQEEWGVYGGLWIFREVSYFFFLFRIVFICVFLVQSSFKIWENWLGFFGYEVGWFLVKNIQFCLDFKIGS